MQMSMTTNLHKRKGWKCVWYVPFKIITGKFTSRYFRHLGAWADGDWQQDYLCAEIWDGFEITAHVFALHWALVLIKCLNLQFQFAVGLLQSVHLNTNVIEKIFSDFLPSRKMLKKHFLRVITHVFFAHVNLSTC